MIAPDSVFAATLAAGEGRRFGGDKLAATIAGMSVLDRSLAVLDGFDWLGRAAVVDAQRAGRWTHGGIETIVNRDPARGMGSSFALAVAAAREAGASALLLTLGDMPFIRHDTIAAILDAASGETALVGCAGGGAPPGPPALIGAAHFARLCGGGDAGARAILREDEEVVVLPLTRAEMRDIDRPEDLPG